MSTVSQHLEMKTGRQVASRSRHLTRFSRPTLETPPHASLFSGLLCAEKGGGERGKPPAGGGAALAVPGAEVRETQLGLGQHTMPLVVGKRERGGESREEESWEKLTRQPGRDLRKSSK